MDLNNLITKKIKEYALDGDADLLDKYGYLFGMIANEYAEAINYKHCCKSDREQLFKDEPHECLDYSQGYDRCETQCKRCKEL